MYLSKEQVRTIIQNAPPGTTPQGIVSGLRNKGIALEGYDATFATSQTPKSMMDTFSEGVNKLYEGFSNLPVIKQGSQTIGALTGIAAAVPSALVNIPGELAVESAKLAAGKGFSLSEAAARGTRSVQEAYKFGQEIGSAAVPAFATGGLGKAAQVVLGVSMAYEGQKNLREGIEKEDYVQAANGATQLIPGILGLKSSIGSALGDVKAGFTPKVPGETVGFAEGAGAAARNLSKDLLIAPELKNQVAREYRYLRYGEEAPVLGAGDIRTLNSAIKPSKAKLTLPQWSKDLETTIHSVSDSLPENPTIVDLDTAIKNAKASTWADVKDSIRKGDEAKLTLDGDAIASAIRDRKNDPRMQLENVKYVRDAITGEMVRAETGPLREIEELAKAYEGKNIDFLSGEAVLESLNAESQMYYKKNMTSRSVAERADPVLAAKLDLAAEIRKQQDALLESIDVSGFKGLKRKYGALRNVGEEVQNRMFMDSKLQISSLAQKIAAGRQAAQMIYGAATGNPAAALSGIADKVLTDYVKSLDEASSKIGRVFDSVRRNKELNAMPSILESAKNIKPGLTVEDVSQRPQNIAIDTGKQVFPKTEIQAQSESIMPSAKLSSEAKKYASLEDFIAAIFNRRPGYAMSHRPSWEGMPTASNLLEGETLPRDVYQHPEHSIASGHNIRTDKSAGESWAVLQKIKDKPESEVTVYRATRKNELNIGDWITFSKNYAKDSIEGDIEKVHSFKIKAKDAVFAGDDINEFGYYPKDNLIRAWNEALALPKEQRGVSSLVDQAKKFDTPEKFLASIGPERKLFRYGGPIDRTKGKNKGISFTPDFRSAQEFSQGPGGVIRPGGEIRSYVISKDAKILREKDAPQGLIDPTEPDYDSIVSYGREHGFDAVQIGNAAGENEIRVLNPKIIQFEFDSTSGQDFKGQLREIWNQANSKNESLDTKAKKYSTASKFIGSQPVVYHGTDKKFSKFDTGKMEGGVAYFTDNKSDFGEGNPSGAVGTGIVMERYLKPNLKLGGYSEADKYGTDELIGMGYDGLKLEKDGSTWYEIFNPNESLLTKRQLSEIWKKSKE